MSNNGGPGGESSRDARRRLRAAGLRATAPRTRVFRLLLEASRPLSHSEVMERLEGDGHDAATVYRNLNDLVEVGLAARMDLGDRVWRFEGRARAGALEHPHALCVDCGVVRCLSSTVEVARPALPPGWAGPTAAVVHGLCGACG